MIKLIHKYNRSIAIVFLIVAACFAFTGVGVDILHDGGSVQQSAIVVNEKRFSDQEVLRAEANIEERYRRMFGDKYEEFRQVFGLNIAQQAVEQMIDTSLISEEAARYGFAGDDETVRRYILEKVFAETPYEEARLRGILQAAGLTYREFSSEIKEEFSRETLTSLLRDASYVSKRQIDARIMKQDTSYEVIAAEVSTSTLAATVPAPSEELIKSFYDSHASAFELPARVSYSFIEFAPQSFEKDVPVTPQDIEVYYTENQAQFMTPEQVRVRELKVLYPKESDPKKMAEAKERAKLAREEAASGKEFKDVVAKYSDDTARKLTGGDRGWVERGTETPQFEKIVFATEPGAVTELIETEYGFQIIKVEEKKASSLKPLEAVRPQIEQAIRKAEAPSYAAAKAQDVLKSARKDGKSLLEVAGSMGFAVKESKALSDIGADPAPSLKGLTEKVIGLPSADRSELSLVEVGDSSVIVQVKEFKEPSIAPLEEVKAKVIEQVKAQEAQKLAEQKAQAVLAATQAAPANFVAEAKKLNVTVIGPAELSRANAAVAALPELTPQISNAVFSTTKAPAVLSRYYPTKAGFLVIAVLSVKKPDLSKPKAEEEEEKYRNEASSEYAQRAVETQLALLKTSAKIEVSPTLQNRR